MRSTLFIALIIGLLFAACEEKAANRAPSLRKPRRADQILIDTRIVLTEDGKTSAIIEANTVKIYEDSSYAALDDSVVINFFNKDGEHTTTLTSMRGEIWGLYDNTDSLKAVGDVVISSEEREAHMEAPAILWVASIGRVYGEGVVRLDTENGFEEGTGFEAKDDLSQYEFKGPVSGEVRGDDIKTIER